MNPKNSSYRDSINQKIKKIQEEVVRSSIHKKTIKEMKKGTKGRSKREKTRESRDAEAILQMIGKEVKRSDILIKNHRKRGTSQRPLSKNTRKKKQGSVNPKRKFEKLVLKNEKSRERHMVKVKKKKTKRVDPGTYATEAPKKKDELKMSKKIGTNEKLVEKYSQTASDWHYNPKNPKSKTGAGTKKSVKAKKKVANKTKLIKSKRLSMAPGFKFSSQFNLNEKKKATTNNIFGHKAKVSLDLMSANILSHKNIQIIDKIKNDSEESSDEENSMKKESSQQMKKSKNLVIKVEGSLKEILDNSKKRDLLSREESKTSIQKLKARRHSPKRINNPFVSTLNEIIKTNPESEYSTQNRINTEGANAYKYSKISENSEENITGPNSKGIPGFNTLRTLDGSQNEKALPILEKSLRRLKKIEKKKIGYPSRESSSHKFSRKENSSKFSEKFKDSKQEENDKKDKKEGNLHKNLGYSWTDKTSNFSSNVKNNENIEGLTRSKMINKEDMMKYIAENYENLKGDLSLLIQNQEKSANR